MPRLRVWSVAFAVVVAALPGRAAYDPLAILAEPTAEPLELVVHDAARDRDIPVLVYLPVTTEPVPVTIFSHGLGGTRFGSSYLGKHWSARGYVAVFVQHPGSDDSVWRGLPPAKIMDAMNQAASGANFQFRIKDIPAVLDQLKVWNAAADHPLHGRLDLDHAGMSGHSFGAKTTQAASGESYGRLGQRLTDPRIDCAIAFSPSADARRDPKEQFGQVKIPWMLMTGTLDSSPIGDQSPADRLRVYPGLPDGDKYELVLDQARHSAFTDGGEGRRDGPRNPNHHRVILALSSAFWDAYLKQDGDALAWLQGDGPRAVMEEADRWQRK